jgi:hypothetical protein
VASIRSRHGELAARLGIYPQTPLAGRLPFSRGSRVPDGAGCNPRALSSGIRVPAPRPGCCHAGIAGASWRRPVRRRAPGPGRPLRIDPPAPQAIICPVGLSQPGPDEGGNDTNGPLLPPGRHRWAIGAAPAIRPAARCRSADTSAAASGDRPPDRPDRGRVDEVLYRRCACRPHGRAAGARLAATCQVVNAASIARRRAEQAGRLGDLAKTNLPGGLPYRSAAGAARDALSASPRSTAEHGSTTITGHPLRLAWR